MAVSTVYSVNATNYRLSPQTFNRRKEGVPRNFVDTIELATTSLDEIGDITLLCPIPSSAIITDLRVFNDDLDSGGAGLTADIGLYYGKHCVLAGVPKTEGAVVDADCFATAITTLSAANILGVNHRFEAAGADIANVGKQAWEVAGLTSDPGGSFYIGFTITGAATAAQAGTLSLVVHTI